MNVQIHTKKTLGLLNLGLLKLLILLACSAGLASTAMAQSLAPADIKVFRVSGTAKVESFSIQGVQTKAVKAGDVLREGATLQTEEGASVALMLSNGSSITIGENSIVEIQDFKQVPFSATKGAYTSLNADPSQSITNFYLHQGEIMGKTRKLDIASTFTVETPLGIAGIRGTTFYVSFGINPETGKLVMNVSNFDGIVVLDTPLEARAVEIGAKIFRGIFNRLAGPRLIEIGTETLVVIEGNLSDVPGISPNLPFITNPVTSFNAFRNSSRIQALFNLLQQVVTFRPNTPGNGNNGNNTIDTILDNLPLVETLSL